MMDRPRLLDLFCGVGGAGMGYYKAGFDVVGVDIKPQPHYPFKFIQADALEFDLSGYDAIHASPPCQDYMKNGLHTIAGLGKYPRLIPIIKNRLQRYPLWVIENVPGAPIPAGPTLDGEFGIMLCGTMFGLRNVRRHRLFLTSIPIPKPAKDCSHRIYAMNPYSLIARKRDGIESLPMHHYGHAMGIDWMGNEDEISEAIPPVYTEYIGTHLMQYLNN